MVFSSEFIPVLFDEDVKLLNSWTFSGEWADMHYLSGQAFVETLEPHFRKGRWVLLFLNLLKCLSDQFCCHVFWLHNHGCPLPHILVCRSELGHVIRPPETFERHNDIVHGFPPLDHELKSIGNGIQGFYRIFVFLRCVWITSAVNH